MSEKSGFEKRTVIVKLKLQTKCISFCIAFNCFFRFLLSLLLLL